MKINWKVRFKSKTFISSLVALVLVFANQVASLFGANIELISTEITNISETVLLILVLMGIVNDHTVKGFGDSKDVLEYHAPYEDEE